MTNEEITAVIQAYKDGKRIQERSKRYIPCWLDFDIREGGWNFDKYDYRIKPEDNYRAFLNTKEVMEAIKKHGDWIMWKENVYAKIVKIDNLNITFGNNDTPVDCRTLFEYYKFADGTPFGKMIE